MSKFDPIDYTKMHGSGNDFIVIPAAAAPQDISAFARGVCRRGTSIGADGVLVIGESSIADFSWRYINADGSDGEMCGNGAMVGARYAVEMGIAPTECTFETAVGLLQATVIGEKVTLRMPDAQFLGSDLRFAVLPDVTFDHFLIGVPHVVGWVDDADAVTDLHGIGRAIRHDSQLQPAGANVNLVHKIDDHTIRMRTYERGVEAETLACGTGAVCSAIASVRHGIVQQPVNVQVSSGMTLVTSWQASGDLYTQILLAGETRIVARGAILADAMR
ncbi:MAG: diaminopimelate epimerase [Thermomicrobiales bacterium]|nr:diaminopimelate epimerase [Thermomicrobiales bacterium]